MSITAGKLALEFLLIDGGTAVAKRIGGELDKLGEAGKRAGRHFAEMADHFNAGLKSLATSKALWQDAVRPGLEAAATLQQAMASVAVELPTKDLATKLRQVAEAQRDAQRIAGPTKFSSGEVALTQSQLLQGGLKFDNVVGKGAASEAAAMLSTANGADLQTSVSAMLTASNTFGLAGDQFMSTADLLARAASSANTGGVGALTEAVSQASQVKALGVSQEETYAALALVAGYAKTGGAAGTTLNSFLSEASKNNDKMRLGLFDDKGKFKGLEAASESINARTASMNPHQRSMFLEAAFGREGLPTALALADKGSMTNMLANIAGKQGIEERVGTLTGTLRGQSEALGGSVVSTMETLFQPALDPLADAARRLNETVGAFNEAASAPDSNIAKAVSYGAMGALGGSLLYGGARMAQGGLAGLRGFGALGGVGGLAGGLATGKAVELATGVQSVFVVNWPGSMGSGGGASGALADAAAAGAGGQTLRGLVNAGGASVLGRLGIAGGAAAVGTAGAGAIAGTIGIGALAGAAIGTAINKAFIEDTALGEGLQKWMAKAVLALGAGGLVGLTQKELQGYASPQQINVKVDVDASGQATATTAWTAAANRSGAT